MALSTAKLKEWLAADLLELDLPVIHIDELRVGDYVLVAAIGIDGAGDKHLLAVALGATENAAVVKPLLADLGAISSNGSTHRCTPGSRRYCVRQSDRRAPSEF